MNLSTRLKQALSASSLKQKDLAKRIGVTPSAITQWKTGNIKQLEASNLLNIARELGINPEWLATGKGEMSSEKHALTVIQTSALDIENENIANSHVFIPELKVAPVQGTAIWDTNPAHQQAFDAEWAMKIHLNPTHCAWLSSPDRAMEPRIQEGDCMVVDYHDTQPQSNKVYVLATNGELAVRRIHVELNKSLSIRADSSDKKSYPDKEVAADQVHLVQIIGRVIAVSGGI
ncbi:helix-turn-helix domain-containing protein [Deefgea piscis]|uniref:helix-turn-helix domain-containing protein n=1 Tax=Deefgea piscis TaxID=2739061 RepID=UPI001C7F9CBB|nr:helix-turn-helix domain-containing protein [Deefgea piscis]QZA80258.1 helix-turn-helix domain-containing protein [Deefgea piscis]